MEKYQEITEKEQLEALYDQQIYLLQKELEKVNSARDLVLEKAALQAAADPEVAAPVAAAYSKAMAQLYLKRREKKIIEIECNEEQEAYGKKLIAIKDKLAKLESDIKEMKETV